MVIVAGTLRCVLRLEPIRFYTLRCVAGTLLLRQMHIMEGACARMLAQLRISNIFTDQGNHGTERCPGSVPIKTQTHPYIED
jgi:hypothetical protein